MLSKRARSVLLDAGRDPTDTVATAQWVRGALEAGARWRHCGPRTRHELAVWSTKVLDHQINDVLMERGAIALLESRGYTVLPPDSKTRPAG